MIVVTGAAGFIGSCLLSSLREAGYVDLVAVDDFGNETKNLNLQGKELTAKIDRKHFSDWICENHRFIQIIFHLGARTDTTEFNYEVFQELNVDYSKQVWKRCVEFGLPLIYASSAATYGLGELGFEDNHSVIKNLKPLNPYGESKNEFDIWAVDQKTKPYFWSGLKFFNVYGPNEYHKGRMASVIFHAFNQIKQTGGMKLFRSHNPNYRNGEQLRDFIYVKDVCDVCIFLMESRKHSGIYNLGTGKSRTFLDLTKATFAALKKEENIQFIDTPEDIRDKYQYFTEANMAKLRSIGYNRPFRTLEEGIADYVGSYLLTDTYF
ncbi:MAG: ADP-glyceromanno-heptose 6-epimerase [Flavobacteriales bacterium]|nr:ADP-glyceromanno-heptose 6-epimerase [Flavobacteriales bacterium]